MSYELITDMTTNEIAKAMIDGEVFYNDDGRYEYYWDGRIFTTSIGGYLSITGDIYRHIEKPVEWWEDLDSLKFPIALVGIHSNDIVVANKLYDPELIAKTHRPATKEEVQQLLNNVWEG